MDKESGIKHQYGKRNMKGSGLGFSPYQAKNNPRTVQNNPNLLTEKWVSLCNNITNKHSWQTGVVFHDIVTLQ